METEKTIAIAVLPKNGETIRRYLIKYNIIRKDLKIIKDENYVYFPVKIPPKELKSFKITKLEFEKLPFKINSYQKIALIPDELKKELPSSYDVIGDIILIKLSKKLINYKKEIGESLLKSNKNIKTVCLSNPVSGEFRTRNVSIIAGEKNYRTIHKEYGLNLRVDVKNTYFSPRLANERKRISSLVKSGEIVVDMFAGVAPFSIMIAKYANPKIVYAVDKNIDALRYATQNINRNNVLDKVEVICKDAKEITSIIREPVDRIIMNLPFSSYKFFNKALKITKECSMIHYYDILKEENIQDRINYLMDIAIKNKISLTNIKYRKIKTYAPREFYIGIDITATKNADVA